MNRYTEQYAHICMHVYMYTIGPINKQKKKPAVFVYSMSFT